MAAKRASKAKSSGVKATKTRVSKTAAAKVKTSKKKPAAPSAKAANSEGWSNPCLPQKLAKGEAAIRLWHAAAPTCYWSWGYEGTLHRIRLVYGDQVDIRFVPSVVHTDFEAWLHHNGLTRKTMDAQAAEAGRLMGIPIWTEYSALKVPNDQTPATRAVVASFRQGHPSGERFMRELLRRNVVEGKDVTRKPTLLSAAKASGLDLARFTSDLQDTEGLDAQAYEMGNGLGHIPLGFYNLILQDDQGRTLLIDYAFDPKPVEEAIEFLTGKRLKKNRPTDPLMFLRVAGPTHEIELSRAFGWPAQRISKTLALAAKRGEAKQVLLAGHPYWMAT